MPGNVTVAYGHNYTNVSDKITGAAAHNTQTDNTVVADGPWPPAARRPPPAARKIMRHAGARP